MLERPDHVVCILDERATNARIHEREDDRIDGLTLCSRDVPIEQRSPRDEPAFDAEGSINPAVVRRYAQTWSIESWFNAVRSGTRYVACPECAKQIGLVLEVGVWDGARDPEDAGDVECGEADLPDPKAN